MPLTTEQPTEQDAAQHAAAHPTRQPGQSTIAQPASRPAAQPGPRGTARVELRIGRQWLAVCDLADLTPGRGVAALLPDGRQAALFLDRAGDAYAIGNQDPFSGACVLSRGLLGRVADGRPFVASPLLKQRFDLATGRCLDDDSVHIPSYPVRTR